MESKSVIISAPGKVILHGEHAVVYGKKAVAAGLNLRTYLKLKACPNHQVVVSLPDININKQWDLAIIQQTARQIPCCDRESPSAASVETLEKLKQLAGLQQIEDTRDLAILAFLYLYINIASNNGELLPIEVVLSSRLPPGAGLGSSAAFSTCLAGALLVYTEKVCSLTGDWNSGDLELINKWAFQSEKIIHGNPSGIDNSVSTYGGAVMLQSGKLSFLESIPKIRILLINTKVPRSTKVLVASVREKYNKYPEVVSPILDAIEAISDKGIAAYNQMATESEAVGAYSIIKDLVDMNQELLSFLGVSHAAIDKVLSITSKYGTYGKLTGAGGGGCVFAIIPPDVEEQTLTKLKAEIEETGYDCWETSIGAAGVSRHSTLDASYGPLQLFVP